MREEALHESTVRERCRGERGAPLWIAGVLLVVSFAAVAVASPGGLLTKLDLVGYAVCHQIESHSLTLAGRPLPLCARCTGTFLGALVGLFGQAAILRRRRAAAFPPPTVLVVLIAFTASWAADGVNSYLALVGGSHLYEPSNPLRLITGSLNGLTMGALIYPLFNASFWERPVDRPSIRGWRDLAILLVLEGSLVGLILSGQEVLLYPVSLLSAAAVLTLLGSVNSVLAVVVMGRENSAESWRQALLPMAVGLLLALVQVAIIDLARYAITGTLDAIPTLQ